MQGWKAKQPSSVFILSQSNCVRRSDSLVHSQFLRQNPSQSLKQLVYTAKMRWHIERDYQELKDELGLNHYEGRNWRGFHHHATLCIAAYAYLVAQRIKASESNKKNATKRKKLTVPNDYIARGSPAIATSC